VKAIKARAKVLNSLPLASLDLKMSDVDQTELTEPNHDFNKPVTHTDNDCTALTVGSRLAFGRLSFRIHHNRSQFPSAFFSSPSFKISLSVEVM
jgi:hypothetical protein